MKVKLWEVAHELIVLLLFYHARQDVASCQSVTLVSQLTADTLCSCIYQILQNDGVTSHVAEITAYLLYVCTACNTVFQQLHNVDVRTAAKFEACHGTHTADGQTSVRIGKTRKVHKLQ